MVDILEALGKANEEVASKFSAYELVCATRMPLKLPFGFRVPYASFVDTFRVRHTMLILYVDDQGNVAVEWDDFAQTDDQDKVKRLRTRLAETKPTLPALPEALARVQLEHPGAQVETIEAVLDDKLGEDILHWRIGIVEDIDRSVVLVSGKPDEATISEVIKQTKYMASVQWGLGHAQYKAKRLEVDLTELEAEQSDILSHWTVWSCMARLTEFLESIDFGAVDHHNVQVDLLPGEARNGAKFDPVGDRAAVAFYHEGGWGTDVSIILHELAHALWYLLYTRPPRCIDTEAHEKVYDAVKEAFADYVAATIFAQDNEPVEIGGHLSEDLKKSLKLPRPVNSEPFNPGDDEKDAHQIGRQWSSLLWDFRGKVGWEKADRAVIIAHIKPRVDVDGPAEPMACYFQSLKNTVDFLNDKDPDNRIDFDAWDELAQAHGLAA